MRPPRLLSCFAVAVSCAGAAHAQAVNDCTFETATNWFTGFNASPPTRTIAFAPFAYSPACVKVEMGDSVTFSGVFSSHPLNPGIVTCPTTSPDPSTDITLTSTGTSKSFNFVDAGEDPFYCGFHFCSHNMHGAVFIALFADGFERQDLCHWAVQEPAVGCP